MINNKDLEKFLGYEINKFEIVSYDPVTKSLSVMVEPKKMIEYINIKMTIVPSGGTLNDS